jgi:protein-disulfide isomerase
LSQRSSRLAEIVLALCAVVVTGLVARRELFPSQAPAPSAPRAQQVRDWRPYAAAGHEMGPAGAAVSIVVFSDFQCPACRALASSLKAIRAEFPRDVIVKYRHAPLPIHPFAVAAARASECAAHQNRFEQFHDALFLDQPTIGLAPWTRFATAAGVPDVAGFEQCMAAAAPSPVIARDTMDAHRLQVAATPTLLVNDLKLVGVPPMDTLRAVVNRAVAASRG